MARRLIMGRLAGFSLRGIRGVLFVIALVAVAFALGGFEDRSARSGQLTGHQDLVLSIPSVTGQSTRIHHRLERALTQRDHLGPEFLPCVFALDLKIDRKG